MDQPRVSTVRRHSPTDAGPADIHLSVWVEGHVDFTVSETFRKRHTEDAARPMARPVRLEWHDHNWSESLRSHRPKGQHTNRSTAHRDGNVAAGAK